MVAPRLWTTTHKPEASATSISLTVWARTVTAKHVLASVGASASCAIRMVVAIVPFLLVCLNVGILVVFIYIDGIWVVGVLGIGDFCGGLEIGKGWSW